MAAYRPNMESMTALDWLTVLGALVLFVVTVIWLPAVAGVLFGVAILAWVPYVIYSSVQAGRKVGRRR